MTDQPKPEAPKKKFPFNLLPEFKKPEMMSFKDFRMKTQVGKSMFRHGYSDDDRDRALTVLTNVFFHLHPVRCANPARVLVLPGARADFPFSFFSRLW